MAGDILQPARAFAVGEREAELGGRALRRGNAGNDLDRDIGSLAGRDFLGCAAEDQRIAALEAHDALALFGEAHHQRIDVVLLAGGSKAGLADQHLARLAAGKVEHVARNQIVEQNHVGRLQRAHGAQRQQFRIARAGAHKRYRAVLDGDA